MEISAIIDGILECKESTGMTFQQIADRADQPKSTVTRILRKETPNPSMKALMDIAVAVGYEIDPIQPAVLKDSTKDAYIAYLQQALEVERLSRKADVAEQKALRHQVVAEKNRTIFLLSIALILSLVFLIGWLTMELLHPSAGWIRFEEAHHATNAAIVPHVPLIVRNMFSLFNI